MEQHDLEITIGKDGKVQVRVAGAKGKQCLQYAQFLEQIVGKLQRQDLTYEFYEPDTGVQVEVKPRQQIHRKE